jgi:hypothetical protein
MDGSRFGKRPDTIYRHRPYPITPRPQPTAMSLAYTPGHLYTSIVRHWMAGDARLCQLCPAGRCVAQPVGDRDACHLLVPGEVTPLAAPFYSTVSLPREASTQVEGDRLDHRLKFATDHTS